MKKLLSLIIFSLLFFENAYAKIDLYLLDNIKRNLDEYIQITSSRECEDKGLKFFCEQSEYTINTAYTCLGKNSWEDYFKKSKFYSKKYSAWNNNEKEEEILILCASIEWKILRTILVYENKKIEKLIENKPPENKKISFQCYYDENKNWIDYEIKADREFLEYYLFKYRKDFNYKLNLGVETYSPDIHNPRGSFDIHLISDTAPWGRAFRRINAISYDYGYLGSDQRGPKPSIQFNQSDLIFDNNKKDVVWDFKWSHTDKISNSIYLNENTLKFTFDNQQLITRDNSFNNSYVNETSKISLSTGVMKFDREVNLSKFDRNKMGITEKDFRIIEKNFYDGSCVGIEELYNYIKHIKLYMEKFEELRAELKSNKKKEDIKSGEASGTAFFVSKKGHLLTNEHVIDGCKISKINYQGKEYDTELIASDKKLDLALLKANLENKSYIDFSDDEPIKMQKIYVGGYPLGKGLSDDLKVTSGIVSSLKGFEDNSNEIQIDAAINPGNSGGPIIDEKGELVAIAVAALAKDVTEGINFGIKSSAAESFLKSNKIKPNKSFFAFSKDSEKLLNILEESTVYTFCELN